MPNFTCPECKKSSLLSETNYNNTIQCEKCSEILKVRIKDSKVVNVRSHKIDLEIPDGLSDNLEKVLDESVSCYEIGCFAASVVMSGLFMEGALKEAKIRGDRLVDMINNAKADKKISMLSYHMATASRIMRNTGAHYSDDLAKISDSEARIIMELARKMVIDLIDSGAL